MNRLLARSERRCNRARAQLFFLRLRHCGYSWCLALLSSLSQAEFIEPRGELTLADVIAATLQHNPALQSANFEVRIAETRITQAKLRPNPELAASFENFAGTIGGDRLESTLSLSQVIELGGKRERRIEVASYSRDNAAIEREAQQLDVLAEATRRFIDVAVLQQQLLLLRRDSEISAKNLATIAQRVAAARTPAAEKNRAQITLGRSRLQEQHSEQVLLSAHRRLAAFWGSSEPQFASVSADLFVLPAVAGFADLSKKLAANPDFLRFVSERRLRDAEWQLATAEAKSNITVGAGLRRFEESGDSGFVVNFSMPLSFNNRNQGAIRSAALRREQVEADSQTSAIAKQATLFEFYQLLQQARNEVTVLREQLVPQAEAALTQTQYGYERGRFSYLELADAQRELIALQRDAINSAATYHRARAEIERLTNTALAAQRDQ